MDRNHNNFWIVVIFILLGIIAFSGGTKQQAQIDVPQAQDYKTTTSSYPDWTLLIPEIDFNQQMTKIIKRGSTLSVPDNNPGYYSEVEENLFIVGHNRSVFSRLSELPKNIIIHRNSSALSYTLKNYQTFAIKDIDMDELLHYRGVVIMTCAGERINDQYTHRLILFYQ